MKYLIGLLFSVVIYGQVIHAGSGDDNFFSPVQGCTTTTSCIFTDNTVIPSTLRYSNTPSLNYDFPAAMGAGVLTLGFWEPSATKVGQRVFTVSVNGSVPITLDVFKQAGGQKRYWIMPPINVNVTDGFVHIVETKVTGKPMVATIDYHGLSLQGPKGDPGPTGITGAQGPPGPQGITGNVGAPGPLPTFVCVPTSACSFNPTNNTFTITVPANTAGLPFCPQVTANSLKPSDANWSTTVNVYTAHQLNPVQLDCQVPTPDTVIVLDATNMPIGFYTPMLLKLP